MRPPESAAHLPEIPAQLVVWLSPGFPVGAFAYSHGLEAAADKGWITGRDDLEGWLGDLVARGSLRNDLILLAEAWRAAGAGDGTRLAACHAEALALSPSAERRLESAVQGNAFVAAMTDVWPEGLGEEPAGDHAYGVAVGAAAARAGLALESTLFAYGVAFVSNLVSAAIRLSLVGQTDAQRVIRALLPMLAKAASDACVASPDDVGGCAFAADLASLLHETQYSRLFRS